MVGEIKEYEGLTMESLVKKFDEIQRMSNGVFGQIKDCTDIIRRQNSMIDILLNLMASLAEDGEVDFKIKRRILFAMQQVRGLAQP